MSNIKSAFENGKAFIPFVTCGDPDLDTTEKIIRAAVANGADIIELGIPFSDPTAEGPVIQGANIRALAGGVTTDKIFEMVKTNFRNMQNLRQIKSLINEIPKSENIEKIDINEIKLGDGIANLDICVKKELFYQILSEMSGIEVKEEGELFGIVASLAKSKKSYDKIEMALNDVKRKGYGIVTPNIEDLSLEEPEIIKQGSKFGVKLKARAPSLHIIKAEIETEVSPIVGSEKQSEELVDYLMKEFEGDPTKIWQSNIFGKSLHELVNEGLQTKLMKMPEDAQCKLQETLEKIINEGSGGLICIIL